MTRAAAASIGLDRRVGVRRTEEYARYHARPLDIGDVIAATGEETPSSLRSGEAPMPMTFDMTSNPLLGMHRGGAAQHRRHDVLVSRTAA